MSDMRGVGRWLALMLPLIVLVATGFWLARRESLDWLAKLSEIASFGLAVAALLIPVVREFRWPGLKLITDEEIEADAAGLAAGLREEWNHERSLPSRENGALTPMRLRWEMPTGHGNLRGGFGEILPAFSVTPGGRLVILGESGGGKSTLALELARSVAGSRRPGDQVPVVLPIAQWNPSQKLADWIADQLESDHPGLERRGRDGSGNLVTHAQALVAQVKVIPILDGLDEMPVPLRASAIAGINQHGADKPLVVVSRTAAYRNAVRGNEGRSVARAAELTLCDLDPAAIRDFLAPVPDERWSRLFARLEAEPGGALALALGNPLMLSLCRAIYTDRSPDELADRYRFAQRAAIEDHLLGRFVHAAYSPVSGPADEGGFHCTGEQAQRWLSFLAGHADRSYRPWSLRTALDYETSAPDLSWWHLYRAEHGAWRILGPVVRGIVRVGVIAALVTWILTRHAYWRYGPHNGSVRVRGDLLLAGPLGGLARPVAGQLAPPSSVGLAIAAVVVTFVFMVDAAQVSPPVPVRLSLSPFRTLRVVLTAAVTLPLLAAGGMVWGLTQEPHHLPAGTFIGSHATLLTLLAVALGGLLWLPRTLLVPTDRRGAVHPAESLRLDRQADIVVTLLRRSAVIVILALWCGAQIALAYGIYATTAMLIALLLGGQFSFASRSYTDACWSLGLSRRLPRQLIAFLTDAESRGVLRAVGADYEFRHIRVQQQLHDSWGRRKWLGRDTRRENRRDLRNRLTRREESVAGLTQTVAEYRILAGRGDSPGFAEFGPRLALALTALAGKLHVLGRWDDEVDVISERTEVYRSLAERDPGSFRPRLADSLGALAGSLRETERIAEALGVTREVVDMRRELAAADPESQLNLAGAVSRLMWYVRTLAGHADNLAAIGGVVECLRELEPGDAAIRPWLAEALVCQAFTLRACGRRDEYDEIMAEALDIYRIFSCELRYHDKKLDELPREPVETYRHLAKTESGAFLPDLVRALNSMSDHTAGVFLEPADRAAAHEAHRIWAIYLSNSDNSYLWGAEGAGSLISNLAKPLWKAGQYRDALTVIEIARGLGYKEYPSTYYEGAIQRLQRNSRSYRRRYLLAEKGWTLGMGNPGWQKSYAGYLDTLARYQDNLAFRRAVQGRKDEAAASATESAATYRQIVDIYRKLFEAQPASFLPDLAKSLDLLAAELRKTGNPADSEATESASAEAVMLRRARGLPPDHPESGT
jgi:hypothetical protein